MRGVSVVGGNDVSASATVGEIGVDVSVQANDDRMDRVKKNVFRLINKFSFQDTIPEGWKDLRGSYIEIKIPVSNGDDEREISSGTIVLNSLPCYLLVAGFLPR